jgi:hypothetical protein
MKLLCHKRENNTKNLKLTIHLLLFFREPTTLVVFPESHFNLHQAHNPSYKLIFLLIILGKVTTAEMVAMRTFQPINNREAT